MYLDWILTPYPLNPITPHILPLTTSDFISNYNLFFIFPKKHEQMNKIKNEKKEKYSRENLS